MNNVSLLKAIRQTIKNLQNGSTFKWTHMGHCICGNLVQSVTTLSPREIHEIALEKAGDWRDQALEYCGTTGYTMDHIIETLIGLGLKSHEIAHLERLSDYKVLRRLPKNQRNLDHKNRNDVITYLNALAELIEDQIVEEVDVSYLFNTSKSLESVSI